MMPTMSESSDIVDPNSSEPGMEVEQDSLTPPTVVPEVFEADPRLDSPVQNVIPYRNQCALIGYYFGVFSLIPVLGILLALPAIILGVIGLVTGLKQTKRRGKVHAIVAIILGIVGSYNYVAIIMTIWGGIFGWFGPANNTPPPPPMPGQFPYWG